MLLKHLAFIFSLLSLLSCQPQEQSNNSETNSTELVDSALTSDKNKEDTTFDIGNFQSLVDTYEDPDRSEWQNPELVVDKLGNLKGKVIADIGAGTGYFTFRLAEQGAQVIAIDIEERFLTYIEDRKPELQHIIPDQRIETRLSLADDPLLSKEEVDAAILVNTYHFLSDRVNYLLKIKEGLKKTGQIIIVDYKEGQMPVGPTEELKVSLKQVISELKKAGFEAITTDKTSLEFQYMVSARKN